MERLTIPARVENLDRVNSFLDSLLGPRGCPDGTMMQIRLAVEEIFVNIASYAYAPGEGMAELRCRFLESPTRVEIQLLDSGEPFDPLAREDADTSPDALMDRVGGLGILLVKTLMDEVEYAYRDGQNVLTMRKIL